MKLNSTFLLVYSLTATVLIAFLGWENLQLKHRWAVDLDKSKKDELSVPESLRDELPFFGKKNAPVEILLFSSIGCKSCDDVTLYLEKLCALNQDVVQVRFIFIPTEENSKSIATALIAAFKQGKFREFLVQATLRNLHSEQQIQWLCKEIGCNTQQLNRQRNTPLTQSTLIAFERFAQQKAIKVLPTIFVNGQQIKARTDQALDEYFEAIGLTPTSFLPM